MKRRFYPWVFISGWYTVFWLLIHYIYSYRSCQQITNHLNNKFWKSAKPVTPSSSITISFSQRLSNHFTSITRTFPPESCFPQQQFSWNGKSFLPWQPSTGERLVARGAEDQQHRQENTSVSSQRGRQCLAGWLNLCRRRMRELSLSFPEGKLSHVSELDT